MAEVYPIHALVLTKHPEAYTELAPRFKNLSIASSLFAAVKCCQADPCHLILVDPQSSLQLTGSLVSTLFHVPKLIYDARLYPLQADLSAYYKPAHYHPVIKSILCVSAHPLSTLESFAADPHLTFTYTVTPTADLLHHHDLLILPPESGWGEIQAKAAFAGLAAVAPSYPDLSRLIAHPEEVYQLAKNSQQWMKRHLESDVLPDFTAKKLYETYQVAGYNKKHES